MNETTPTAYAAFAVPLSDTAPSGANLEYDPLFQALEAAVRGTPEVEYGSTITAAQPPDWRAAHALALQLMESTRDLRVTVAYTRALLGLEGVSGLATGLDLLAQLLAQQWQTVHPQLEAEDDFDPMLRVNVLAALAAPGELLRELRDAPLVQVRALGSFTLRDIDAAQTDAEPPAKVTQAVIDAAFAAAEPQHLADTLAALDAALASVHAIERQLAQHVAAGQSVDLAPLTTLLARAAAAVRPHLREAALPLEATVADAVAVAVQRAAPGVYTITSRADVVRLLDGLCAYYAEHEPASPLPLLFQRAKRLVDASFVELLQDLAPDALAQLAHASGVRHEV